MYAPKLPKGAKLVFTTRKIWRHRKAPLEVQLSISSAGESTRISLDGSVNEHVIIENGVIAYVRSVYKLPDWVWPHPDENITNRKFNKRISLALNPPSTPRPQYLCIKAFEKDLRLLPEQDDLDVIYRGDGFFDKSA